MLLMQRITKLDNDLTCKGMLMKLWNKTLLASALCLTLFGCDDASKVDNKLDKAKDNAEQMKDAAGRIKRRQLNRMRISKSIR